MLRLCEAECCQPWNQCVILYPADQKFCVFNKVSLMTLLWTFMHIFSKYMSDFMFSYNLRFTTSQHIWNSSSGLTFMNWLKSVGIGFCTYHHIIAISTPLNWFGPRLRDITVATLVKMDLEWKIWKRCGWNYRNKFIFLSFCVDYKKKTLSVIYHLWWYKYWLSYWKLARSMSKLTVNILQSYINSRLPHKNWKLLWYCDW
jgi:hypothetical protein